MIAKFMAVGSFWGVLGIGVCNRQLTADFRAGSKCINLRSKANINDHIMDFYPLIILSFFRERVGKVPGYTCINLISLGPTRASWTAHTRGGMLLTTELSLSGLKAYQATITASRNCCCVVGGLSISRIWIAIWSQICSTRFISGLLADWWFSRKIIVVRVMYGEALSWNSTKLLRKVLLAQGKTFCLSTRRQTCWFMGPSTITSSLLPQKWTAIDAADRNSTSNPTIELYSWPGTWLELVVSYHLQQNPVFRAFVHLWRCPLGLWLGVLVSLDRFRILEMATCGTLVKAAISNQVRPLRETWLSSAILLA